MYACKNCIFDGIELLSMVMRTVISHGPMGSLPFGCLRDFYNRTKLIKLFMIVKNMGSLKSKRGGLV